MNKKQNICSILIISFLLLIASTFLTSEYSLVSAATKASTVALNTSSTFLIKGESTNLKITGTSKKVTWASTNKSIVAVSSSGKVTAVRYGIAYIKAVVNNKTYKCKVTVMNPTEITFKPADTMIVVNGTGVNLNPVSDIYSAAVLKKAGLTYKVYGNAVVKVSSTGKVTATKAGDFKIVASVHGKKIQTIAMKAVRFDGLSPNEVVRDSYSYGNYVFISFGEGLEPRCEDVKVTVSDSTIAGFEYRDVLEFDSGIDRYDGIYVDGGKDGTCIITVNISGVEQKLTVVVGDGLEKLDPVDAIKENNLSGYTGNNLITLTAIRKFIDDNNLLSDKLSDREKITIIQEYLINTYTGKNYDETYIGLISSVFLAGSGVCASYTETFCFLCECIGIEVYYCIGKADNGNGEGFGGAGHSWNRVKIDGEWYYIDTYWNAGLGNYEYFLSETLWDDHMLIKEGYFSKIWAGNEPFYKNNLD